MAVLSFKVQADYEKVVRLREEIAKLENQLKSFGRNTPIKEIRAVENELAKAKKEFNNLAVEAAESGAKTVHVMKDIAKAAGTMFSLSMAADFATQVATVRGEFQKLEIAFETMLQSKEKANALMAQMVDTAAKTPFDLQSVASGAKQLLAYGVASEQVNETLIRLGDIASGLSIPLGDLVYLYGTTMTQGRMFTMDLRQFQGRGIPMQEELAKVIGVTKKEISELVTAGKVGAKEMEQAIKNMTSEGGKFAGLMEKQAKTITGQISNLEDSIAQMFNEIGQSSEGAISGAIGVVADLVENYKEVGEAIAKVAAVVGTYKAALMAFNAANLAAAKVEKDMLLQLLGVKMQENAADNASVATSGKVIASTNAEIAALKQELAAKLQSLQTTLLTAKAEEAAARTKVERLGVEVSLSKLRVKQAKEELAMAVASGDAEAIAAAKTELATAAKQRNTSSRALGVATRELEIATTNAETAASAVNTLQTNIETAAIDNQTKSTLLLTAAKQKLAALGRGIGKVLGNPYVLAAAGVAALAASIIGVVDALNVEDEARKNVTDSINKYNEALAETKSEGEGLIQAITSESTTNMEKVRAMDKLRALYPQLFKDMSDAEILTMKQVDANKMLADETERLREEELRLSLQRAQEALKAQEQTKTVTGANGATYEVDTSNSVQARRLRKEIEEYEKQLAELEALKKRAEFNALPKEAKIISLKEQIETLKTQNEELDAQLLDLWAMQKTVHEFGEGGFDFGADLKAEKIAAQIAENRKQMEELLKEQEKLEKTEDTSAETAKQKQARYNRKKAAEKTKEDLLKTEVDLENKLAQSRINAMNEGFAKESEQLKLNYKKQKETYDKEQKDILKKMQENEKQKWLAADPENRKEYDFVPTINEDSPEFKAFAAKYAKLGADALAAYNKAVDEAEVKWTFSTRQMKVDSMSEGAAKEREQRLLDNEKELYQLEQQREAYIEAAEAAYFLAENRKKAADLTYEIKPFDATQANDEFDAIVENTEQKQTEYLLEEYMSYVDKKKAIDEDYEADKAELEEAYNKTGDERYKRSLDERHKAYVQSMNALEKEFGTTDYKLIFGDPQRMTSATIEKALEKARKKMSELDKEADPEMFQALSEAIERLENARDNNPFEGWGTSLMDVIQKLHQIRNLEKDIARYQEEGNKDAEEGAQAQLEKAKKDLAKALVGTGVASFGDALTKAADGMKQIAEISGDIDLERQAEALANAGNVISSVASGAASGGWVGAIIGGATSMMNLLISKIIEGKVIAAEAKQAYEDYIDEISHTARTVKTEDYETIFGTRDMKKMEAATRMAGKAWEDYQKALQSTGTTYSYGQGKNKVMRWQDSLENMLVLEGQKKPNKNADTLKNIPTLKEKFGDLFDAEGNIDLMEAEAILKAYSQYSGEEWYEALQDATDALKDYEENMKMVDAYLTNLFSGLGDDLADAIMKGDDALEVLQDSTGQIFASIAKEVIKSAIFTEDFIEGYKERLRAAMGTEDMTDDAEVFQDLTQDLKDGIERGQAAWEEIQRIAAENEIDLSGAGEESQQSASKKGYQTLSEDTGSELSGRTLAMYESNLRIEEATRGMKDSIDLMASNYIQMKNIADESRTLIAHSYLELQQIRDNTGAIIKPIQNLSDKIDGWDSYIKNL